MAGHQSDDERSQGEVTSYHENVPEQFQLFEDLVDLEKSRIQVSHDRNKIALEAIKLADEANKRELEYHAKQLETTDKQHRRNVTLIKQILFCFGSFVLAIVALVFFMAFYGDPEQSALATKTLTEGAKALGGGGIIYLILRAFRFLKSR